MPDPIEPEIPAAITDEPQGDAMAPADGRAILKKTTHEVDADDMFGSTT